MPEYVYALHDFIPENEDEVDFRAGERIEVLEKDDMYQDGWWQGRNLAGKSGLFPVSYTTPAPPSTTPAPPTSPPDPAQHPPPSSLAPSTSASSTSTTIPLSSSPAASDDDPHHTATATAQSKSALQPLPEESEPSSTPPQIVSPVPKAQGQGQATFLKLNGHNGHGNGGADGYESDFGQTDVEGEGETDLEHETDHEHELGQGHDRLHDDADASSLHLDTLPDGEVMKATMTDVQKAIEQLGRGAAGGEDGDGSRSFSFASSRDGVDTETDDTDLDLDMSDVDGGAGAGGAGYGAGERENGDWHKSARRKLADKARKAVEEAEKLEAMLNGSSSGEASGSGSGLGSGSGSSSRRAVAPPIEVELSDESEAEDDHDHDADYTRSSRFRREHPNIMEEDEEDEEELEDDDERDMGRERIPSVVPSVRTRDGSASAADTETVHDDADGEGMMVPPRDESDVLTATARQLEFPVFSPPTVHSSQSTSAPQPAAEPTSASAAEEEGQYAARPPSPAKYTYSYPTPTSPPPPSTGIPEPAVLIPPVVASPPPQQEQTRVSTPPSKEVGVPPQALHNGIPSPSPSSHFGFAQSSGNKHDSIVTSSSAPAYTSAAPGLAPSPGPAQAQQQVQPQQSISTLSSSVGGGGAVEGQGQGQGQSKGGDWKKTHPSEWTLEQVIEWLKSRGFDQEVCDKFMEQEITGDVLLELDVNLLKTEIGIMAFGKRMRIANAITELRRPPSIEYSDLPLSGSEHPSPVHMSYAQGQGGYGQGMGQMQTHSRTQSQSQSHHSFPGSIRQQELGAGMGHSYSQSMASSLGSPMVPNGNGSINGHGNGYPPNQFEAVQEDPSTRTNNLAAGLAAAGGVGLGIGMGLNTPSRLHPSSTSYSNPTSNSNPNSPGWTQLNMSPSDGALKESALAVNGGSALVGRTGSGSGGGGKSRFGKRMSLSRPGTAGGGSVSGGNGGGEEEDRGHMSDGDVVPTATSIRRKLFGRSQDSALSVRQQSQSPMPPASPVARETPDGQVRDGEDNDAKGTKDKEGKNKDTKGSKDKGKGKDKDKDKKDPDTARDSTSSLGSRHARNKKSVDATGAGAGNKHADRLSIFGSTFGGTLKGRKPAPSTDDSPAPGERTSKFSLPRLHGPSSIRKSSSSSQRPTTPGNGNGNGKASSPPSSRDFFGLPSIDSASSTLESNGGGKDKEKEKEREPKNGNTLRKRTVSSPHIVGLPPTSSNNSTGDRDSAHANTNGKDDSSTIVDGVGGPIKQGQSILEQIGDPDHMGWMRKKGDRYNTWKSRYFVLKGPHMYCLRSNSRSETKIKGYIHLVGYKVTVDENIDPGRYGFRIDHDHDKTHYFSSEEKTVVREWMKAIMKATIGRDYSKPVISSCNIPTIPLVVAQAMNPAPRPPSPTARDATQKALRRENPEMLSSRDARVLMGLPGAGEVKDDRARVDTFFSDERANDDTVTQQLLPSPKRTTAPPPPRPSREMRRSSSQRTSSNNIVDDALIDWANSHLPAHLQITDPTGPLCSGLALLRLAESIKGRPSSPPVPDSAFPTDPNDDKLDGLFRLFDFLLDNDVKMGSVSINDVRQGKRDKIVQLLRALKAWEDKRRALASTIAKGSMQAGAGFMVPVVM